MSGEYDSYGLDEVFSTKEKAEAYVASKPKYYEREHWEILEQQLDPECTS